VCEVGAIEELWRYPIKSMLGQRVARAAVTALGLPGDRRLALVDRESGKIASAKAPRLWRDLLQCAASLDDGDSDDGQGGRADEAGAVRIAVPGDKPLWSTDADVDERLSAFIGRPVHLADTPPAEATLDRAKPDEVLGQGVEAEVAADNMQIGTGSPGGTFVDFAPLHLITTSTLKRIAELSPRGEIEQQRYRPNLVIRTSEHGFVENDWYGREVHIGPRLRIKVIAATPRCAVPTLGHGALPRDVMALRTLAEHNRVVPLEGMGPEPCAGVYAQVMAPGSISLGDKVLVSVDRVD
jgi:uncharacterized protein YcbX